MKNKAHKGDYLSPELHVTDAISLKVFCQSNEAPDFGEGWEFDF